MDVHEILRLKQAGMNHTRIAAVVGASRKSVGKYVRWAAQRGLLEGTLPTAEGIHRLLAETMPQRRPPQQTSSVAPYAEQILAMRQAGVEMSAITLRLEEQHQVPVSYEAVRRFVRRHEASQPESCLRLEVAPGEEGQVDFGYAGLTLDEAGMRRKTWAFIMLLSHSRHQFVRLVYDQTIETWLVCHVHAFEFFGGVPNRLVVDNLKAAILRACATDPLVQRAYRELAEHYAFVIDPHPPRRPEIKGQVEQGGVHYFKRNFMAGREPEPTRELNDKALEWCLEVAGRRTHGTTRKQPLAVFESVERRALTPLPRERYDLAVWKEVKLHRDCHAVFEKSYYSAPFRLVGQQLWLRGGTHTVKIYTQAHELVATHPRASEPGERITNPDHLPDYKLAGLRRSEAECRVRAGEIGPACEQLVDELFADEAVDRRRAANRLLSLAERYTAERLEAACTRALAFGAEDVATVRNILRQGLESAPTDAAASQSVAREGYAFVRRACELTGALLGGGS